MKLVSKESDFKMKSIDRLHSSLFVDCAMYRRAKKSRRPGAQNELNNFQQIIYHPKLHVNIESVKLLAIYIMSPRNSLKNVRNP